MSYRNYSAEDFLLDKDFRNWVERPSRESELFWNEYMDRHPEKVADIRKAKAILQKVAFEKYRLPSNQADALWEGILQDIENPEPTSQEREIPGYASAPVRGRRPSTRYLLPAASIALLMLFAGALWWLATHQSEKTYTTRYGGTLEVPLADGSVATLNAHSTLRVPADWDEQPAREVWLEGEAFFQIKKLSQDDNLRGKMPVKFIVHTQGAAVEVLGTQFNVNTRREKVQVVLSSGKVRLKWQEQEVMMKPGELVEVRKESPEYSQKLVSPETYSAWKDDHLVCNATPLREIANTVEDRFGYQLIIQDEGLKDIKVSGTIPLDDIATFNLVISRLVDASFELKGDRVYITR